MAEGIAWIPLSELEDDRLAAIADIKLCEWVLGHGHECYSDGRSVQGRMDDNQCVVDIIDAKLLRRAEAEQDE